MEPSRTHLNLFSASRREEADVLPSVSVAFVLGEFLGWRNARNLRVLNPGGGGIR
jgi:hypothetical protein